MIQVVHGYLRTRRTVQVENPVSVVTSCEYMNVRNMFSLRKNVRLGRECGYWKERLIQPRLLGVVSAEDGHESGYASHSFEGYWFLRIANVRARGMCRVTYLGRTTLGTDKTYSADIPHLHVL